jgi:hypothetical protein
MERVSLDYVSFCAPRWLIGPQKSWILSILRRQSVHGGNGGKTQGDTNFWITDDITLVRFHLKPLRRSLSCYFRILKLWLFLLEILHLHKFQFVHKVSSELIMGISRQRPQSNSELARTEPSFCLTLPEKQTPPVFHAHTLYSLRSNVPLSSRESNAATSYINELELQIAGVDEVIASLAQVPCNP